MSNFQSSRVFASDGREGVVEPAEAVGGQPHCRIVLGDRAFIVPSSLLQEGPGGSYHLPFSLDELTTARMGNSPLPGVIPVIEERLHVEKRLIDTAVVRIQKHVEEHEQVVDEPLMEERVEVERVPVNRLLSEPEVPHQEGDAMVIPVMEEILYVEKRLVLKEEIRITKQRSETHKPQTVTLRSEAVEIERRPVEQPQ